MQASAAPAIHALVLAITMLAGSAGKAEDAGPGVLIPQLGDEDFQIREQATRELIRIGRKAPAAIQKLCLHELLNNDDPEIATRCRQIILELLTEDSGLIGIRHFTTREFNGLEVRNATATISEILPGLPAEAAGLRLGDRIVSLDGEPLARIDTAGDLSSRIGAAGSGKEIELEIRRGDETLKVKVTTARKSLEQQGIDADELFKNWLLEQQVNPPPQ